jgi:hypothetical protein
MLCSDGLTTMVDDQTILDAVERHRPDLREAAKALVNAANQGGGEDNITVIFFEVDAAENAGEPAERTEETAVRSALADDDDTIDESHAVPPVAVVEPDAKPEERRGRVLPILAALAVLLIIAAAVLWLLDNM